MIRTVAPCLLFLFCHLAGTAAAQAFPLDECKRQDLPVGSDCVLFKSGGPDTANQDFRQFRTALGEPANMSLGVALSGGGSKAAPFAMGVLAGLSDTGLLDKVDAVSTVSGGSYAAYFYFNRLVARHKMRENGEHVPADYVQNLFRDCTYPYHSLSDLAKAGKLHLCAGLRDPASPLNNIHQAYVRCRQDLLEPMNCSASPARPDGTDPGSFLGLLATTAASLPFHHFANTLFDLGVNMSPSRATYRAGLGSAYGLIPVTADAVPLADADSRALQSPTPKAEYFANATTVGDVVQPAPYTHTDLQAAYLGARRAGGDHVPLWIANAHATQSRSLWGWNTWFEPDFDLDIFEFTPFYVGSGRYGYWNKPMRGMDLLGATAASAAFLDPNTRMPAQAKIKAALIEHLSNVDWGTDIRNWNVGTRRVAMRPFLPVPLYWIDSKVHTAGKPEEEKARITSPFIRLIDGGSGDDLGAYSLISRGVKNIIIADAAQDIDGKMDDMCVLHKQLKDRGLHLHVPALEGFADHCATVKGMHVTEDMGYPVRKWPHPVIAGCVSDGENDERCESPKAIRVFLVKPAIDIVPFLKSQGGGPGLPRQVAKCAAGETPADDALPCEAAGFILDNIESAKRCHGFPQHSTVTATAYSSAQMYGAYRELARHYVHRLGHDIGTLEKNFREWLEWQRQHQIIRHKITRYMDTRLVKHECDDIEAEMAKR